MSASASDTHIYDFDLNSPDDIITLPATVEGKPTSLLFDTGASRCALDPSVLHLNTPIGTAAEETTEDEHAVAVYSSPQVSCGPFHLGAGDHVAGIDVGRLRATTGCNVVGVLGNDMWRQWVVQINFDDKRLSFLSPDRLPHPEWGTAIDLDIARYSDGPRDVEPNIRANIGGFEGLFILDTGTPLCLLPSPYPFDLALKQPGAVSIDFLDGTPNEASHPRLIRVPTFDIGRTSYHRLLFKSITGWEGSLGLHFLSRHLVTIDWPNHKIYLKPGKRFQQFDEYDMSGMFIERRQGEVVVTEVTPAGPAAHAGVRRGDHLLEVAGRPATGYDILSLKRLLCSQSGLELKLKFAHTGAESGDVVTALIKLARQI